MTPREIVDALKKRINPDSPMESLGGCIEKILHEDFELSKAQAADIQESKTKQSVKLIEREIDRDLSLGIPPALHLSDNKKYIGGSCKIALSDPPETAKLKQGRKEKDAALIEIKALTPKEFEIFCFKILKELGCTHSEVTKLSADQGVDFIGQLNLGKFLGLPSAFYKLVHDIELFIIGQAKHYPSARLGPTIIREVLGSVQLAKHELFYSSDSPLENFNIKPYSPVMSMIFTTGDFTKNAEVLAKKTGTIIKNGQQLATFLTERGIGIDSNSQFSRQLFKDWLIKQ
jgi:hypothetical protein